MRKLLRQGRSRDGSTEAGESTGSGTASMDDDVQVCSKISGTFCLQKLEHVYSQNL